MGLDEKSLLEAIRQIVQEENKPILSRLDVIEENVEILRKDVETLKDDVETLKDESPITRHSRNLLLSWAEKADHTIVNVGLYDKDEK